MLDIKLIKEKEKYIQKKIKQKGCTILLTDVINAHEAYLDFQKKIETLRSELNAVSKKIKKITDSKNLQQAKRIKNEIKKIEPELAESKKIYAALMSSLPNIASDDTPVGKDESANVVVKTYGKKPTFTFTPKPHWELSETLDIIDKEQASIISGSRFAFIKNELALMQFAIIQYTFSVLTNEKTLKKIIKAGGLTASSKPFIPILPPTIVRKQTYEAMARLNPEDDKYKLEGDENQYLAGSAEHTIGALHMNDTLEESELPARYVGYSTCFRREAGTYGKDTRGIYRMHQFDKIEMESFSTKEQGLNEHMFFIALQEYLLQKLELHYQVVAIATGDMGAPDYKQMDIETWMPGQKRYGETHSADYVTDYQPRRLKTYVRRFNGEKELVHMNDATAFAIGRLFIALLEQKQQKDGSVVIPKILRKYMSGIKKIVR